MIEFFEKNIKGIGIIVTLWDFAHIIVVILSFITKMTIPENALRIMVLLLAIINIVACVLYYLCKCDLVLYESLANERPSLLIAIRMILNNSYSYNEIKIEKAILDVCIPSESLAEPYSKDDIYDFEFKWKLIGKNNSKKDLTRFYFRLSGNKAVDLNAIAFKATQIDRIDDLHAQNYDLHFDSTMVVQKQNFFILPLEFRKNIEADKKFEVEVSYTWPKCYNPQIDYLIIDGKNFSSIPLDEFEIHVLSDGKVIDDKYNIRLFRIEKRSPKINPSGLIKVFDYDSINKLYNSSVVKCESKYIYFVEMIHGT